MKPEPLLREPQNLAQKAAWFYEQMDGLNLVHEIRDSSGKYLRTDQILIPWRKVLAYAKRRTVLCNPLRRNHD